MKYLFSNIALIIFSTLGYFQIVKQTYASFQDWETNPRRYMIENPDGVFFEEAVRNRIQVLEQDDRPWGCFRLSMDVSIGLSDDTALFDYEFVPLDSIANHVLQYFSYNRDRNNVTELLINDETKINIQRGAIVINYNQLLTKRKIKFFKEVSRGLNLYHKSILKQIEPDENVLSPHSKKIFKLLSNKLDFLVLIKDPPPPPPPYTTD